MKKLGILSLAILAVMFIAACMKDQVGLFDSMTAGTTERNGECVPTVRLGTPEQGGNDVCDAGYEFTSGRFNIDQNAPYPQNGTFGPISWTIDETGKILSWSGDVCGLQVIVKGGNASYIYTYDVDCKSGSNLVSPLNNGGNTPEISNITFCWNECDEVECTEETAFGGVTKGGGKAWWYAFDTQGAACQAIYAGQKLMAGGQVCYNAVTDELTITLGPGWSLQSGDETVKIQGYNVLPTSRPAAGLFTTYKGTSLGPISGNGSRYYVIHLDAQYCE